MIIYVAQLLYAFKTIIPSANTLCKLHDNVKFFCGYMITTKKHCFYPVK